MRDIYEKRDLTFPKEANSNQHKRHSNTENAKEGSPFELVLIIALPDATNACYINRTNGGPKNMIAYS